ncbi:uncharacterized protein LOC101453510 [Ceratitis capitata]|uniref:uncharacterized protein LOC101453510 n=1 Tax=Ceratitis capitata TaxID=7213 RepID=UPI00032A1440|nr:uncharacterized protein LOC101453510 [Ceratitis capitata]
MPTRPYKRKIQAKDSKVLSLDETCDSAKKITPATSQPSTSRNTPGNSLDKLLLHNSDDLKLREKHCLFPAFNVGKLSIDNIEELNLHLNCTVSMPCPIYISNKHCESVDLCHRRTMAREIYRKRLHTSRTRYQTLQNNKKFKTNERENSYHNSFFELAKRLECDPDPYFHGSYDYYYTGGNLCLLDDGEHVLHVDGPNLNNLNVGILPKFRSFSRTFLDSICSQKLQSDTEVFELRAIQNLRTDFGNFFAMRHRNAIDLHSVHPDGNIKSFMRFKSNSTPFISFAQSSIDSSTFIITTMKQNIRVYDINNPNPILAAAHDICPKNDPMRISWNMVRPWQSQTYLYANERKFCVIDTRTTPAEWLKTSCFQENMDYDCDFISSIAKSEFRDLAYVATNHKLHCLDLRYLGGDFEASSAAVCRWTHQLEYAPAFIDTFRVGGVELIAISSALANDMVICELSRQHMGQTVDGEAIIPSEATEKGSPENGQSKKSIYKSYCLPYQPPTLQEAYQQARLAGKCLQPDADLPSRIARCSTGLSFIDTLTFSECIGEDDCDTFALLLTSNSIGDVYAHRLIEKEAKEPDTRRRMFAADDENSMFEYAKRVCEFKQPSLNCTEVVNLKAMRKVFRCNTLSTPFILNEDDKSKVEVTPSKRRGLGRWQKRIQTLHNYKDALVQDLLSIWDIDYEDDKKDISFSYIKKGLGVKPDPETIVNSWLDENMKSEDKREIPIRGPLPENGQQYIEHFDSTVMAVVHAPHADINETVKMETSICINDTFDALNNSFTSEFEPQQQSTQLVDTILNMPDSPTEQEEFISTKPKPKEKPTKKKSKYVKGF